MYVSSLSRPPLILRIFFFSVGNGPLMLSVRFAFYLVAV